MDHVSLTFERLQYYLCVKALEVADRICFATVNPKRTCKNHVLTTLGLLYKKDERFNIKCLQIVLKVLKQVRMLKFLVYGL